MRSCKFCSKKVAALILSAVLAMPSMPVYAYENEMEVNSYENETEGLYSETDVFEEITQNVEETTQKVEEITQNVEEITPEIEAPVSEEEQPENEDIANLGANISGITIDTSTSSSGTGYSYNASSKTLTLNGLTSSTPVYYGSEGETSRLKLVINGTNTISPSALGKGLVLYGETEISGSGKLTISDAYCGIKMYGDLTQLGGTVEIKNSQYGIDVNTPAQTDSEYAFVENGGTMKVVTTTKPAIEYVNVEVKSGSATFESATTDASGYAIYSKYCDVTVSGGRLEVKATSASGGGIHAGTVNVSSDGILVAEGKTAVYLDAKSGDASSGTFSINGGKLYLKGGDYAVSGCGASSSFKVGNYIDAYLIAGTSALSNITSGIDSRAVGASADSLEALSSDNSAVFSLRKKVVRFGNGYNPDGQSTDEPTEESGQKYDEETKTLTLKSVALNKPVMLGSSGNYGTYTLVLEGNNSIICDEPSVDAVTCYGNLIIKGSGTLDIRLSQGDFGIYVIPSGLGDGKLTVENSNISIDVPICGIRANSMEMKGGQIKSTISLDDYSDFRAGSAYAVYITENLTISGGVLIADSRAVGSGDTGATAITCTEYSQSGGRVTGYGYYSNNTDYSILVSGMNGLAAETISVSGGELTASGEVAIFGGTTGGIKLNSGNIAANGRAVGISVGNGSTIRMKNANVESFGNAYAAFPVNSLSVDNTSRLQAGSSAENKRPVTMYSGEKYLLYGNITDKVPEEKDADDVQVSTTLTAENTTISYRKNKTDFVYTGNRIKPSITVKYLYSDGTSTKKVTLKENVDYIVSTENDINVGTARLRVTGIGDFDGYVDAQSYTISQKDIKNVSFETPVQVAYRSDLQDYLADNITVLDGSVALESDQYELNFANLPDSAPATMTTVEITVKASSAGNYTGTAKKKIQVKVLGDISGKDDIAFCTLKWGSRAKSSYVYKGKAIKPKVEVYLGDVKLTGKNYKLVYENNLHAGTGKVYVVGTGKCYGKSTESLEFDITPKSVKRLSVTAIKNRVFGSDNTQIMPVVKDGSKVLSLGTDYTFEFKAQDNTEFITGLKAIRATYTLSAGTGSDYEGSREIVVTLVRKSLSNRYTTSVKRKDSCSINNNGGKLSVQVLYNGTVLEEGKDYRLTYSAIRAGKNATVTITGIGNYSGSRKIKYKVYS